ncbi:MAG: ammonium transporter [Deltaproteobacteria bacterium]|nr:ammonium transporter [Deltaproteobacteria bacterium]
MNTGDTAWVLTCSALVLLMTMPGLAFFYGGLVRRKNVLSILMQCFIILCVISLQWVLFGYSLTFGPDIGGIIGNLDWFALNGVGGTPNADYAATIPHGAFMIFQAMFAVITPALIIGTYAERIKFSAFLIFTILWATFVYDPLGHWVWGMGGWLKNLGALDFAGGIVVHTSSGVSALVLAILIGKRVGYGNGVTYRPHNLPFAVLGGALLWFGWFGFNAGSALGANELATNAFITTNTATAAAGLTWALIEWKLNGAPTALGVVTGAVAGLVAITPACGFVNPINAIFIGTLVGVFCYIAVAKVKALLGYDDSLDAFGVHGVGGIWGTLATGLFAEKAVNDAGANGLFFGNTHQFLIQCLLVVVTIIYAAVMTWVIFKFVDAVIGMRVDKKAEIVGLDLTQHRESAYTLIE